MSTSNNVKRKILRQISDRERKRKGAKPTPFGKCRYESKKLNRPIYIRNKFTNIPCDIDLERLLRVLCQCCDTKMN